MIERNFFAKRAAMFGLLLALLMLADTQLAAQEKLPRPVLVFTEKKDYEANGRELTLYRLDVQNKADFPAEMFEPAPDLPPCGRNANSSRSWVNIYGENGKRIYGFCALKSPDELSKLAFNVPRGTVLNEIYIVIHDRRLNKRVKSEPVSVYAP